MITTATNERTVIFAVIPNGALGHSGALAIFGSSYSETSRAQQTGALLSSPPSEELR